MEGKRPRDMTEQEYAVHRSEIQRRYYYSHRSPSALLGQMTEEEIPMQLNEYQEAARRTQNPDLNFEQREHHALHGLAAEVGEIHALYQKLYQGHTVNEMQVAHELGDLLWFVAEMSDTLNIPLDEIARLNLEKLRRRYPDGFDEYHSLHRNPEDID